jgi:hypothetical protein
LCFSPVRENAKFLSMDVLYLTLAAVVVIAAANAWFLRN